MWNAANQRYRDGEGTDHSASHANFFPMAFGLVPESKRASVLNFIRSRGMAPSVYGAQYLLEALYEGGDPDFAFDLMTTNGQRGWLNMINIGSTITTEAWDFVYKPNMDWNHAWGAAPGNIIPRYVMGLRPLEAGFGRVLVQPQLGTKLSHVEGTIPTIRGTFFIRAENDTNDFRLLLEVPGNVTANVMLPAKGHTNGAALMNGDVVSGTLSNGWLNLTNIGAGRHAIWLVGTNPPPRSLQFSNWTSSWFGTNAFDSSVAGELADPDNDGTVNFVEFSMGGNPLIADAQNYQLETVPTADGEFTVRFRQRKGLENGAGAFLESTNLLDWASVVPNEVLTIEDLGEAELVEASFSVQETAGFYRLLFSP
jgi:hypothetical protein